VGKKISQPTEKYLPPKVRNNSKEELFDFGIEDIEIIKEDFCTALDAAALK
jgi:hypothetical protein